MKTVTNDVISERLSEYADTLAQQEANPFRIRAYRRAAATVANLAEPVSELYRRGGIDALVELPGIGTGIAAAVVELIRTGRWSRLERLRGELDPVQLFQTVPGVGPRLAERIHDELGIDSLEELEVTAHDGRLDQLPGIGHRRAYMIRAALEAMLSRPRPVAHGTASGGPAVDLLLRVDETYREKAQRGELPTIAPKRFNPEQAAWLPVLHTQADSWHFTALYSNTARAHQLGRTRDWVVIYFYDDHHEEGQHTVVTETRGPLAGRRVVRGREGECEAHYRTAPAAG